MEQPKEIIVAGAGIAGLTAALAFAAKGFSVSVFERARKFEEVGAGLQLSPNASRLLDRLGVLELLRPHAVQPDAVVLRKAATLRELARVPLGERAERRWKAPYLVAHRADLQAALLERVLRVPAIELAAGVNVTSFAATGSGISVSANGAGGSFTVDADLLIGADGVWSATRALLDPASRKPLQRRACLAHDAGKRQPGRQDTFRDRSGGRRHRLPAPRRPSDRLSPARWKSLQPGRLHARRARRRGLVRQSR